MPRIKNSPLRAESVTECSFLGSLVYSFKDQNPFEHSMLSSNEVILINC